MTYNVHGCVGLDWRLDLLRVARVIEAERPDVVALQELDVERSRSRSRDQPRLLAEHLGMHLAFSSARECDGGRYGNAVLSRHPLESIRSACLPRLHGDREERALQWVKIHAPRYSLNILNTHFGLDQRERLLHAETILGPEWAHDACAAGPTIVCGDFNASPRSPVYRQLTALLRDAQLALPHARRSAATFPAILPVLRIDHVFVSSEIAVIGCRAARGLRARLASDHLPLVADVDVPEVPP
jgi:endonuclease/exonuclease/phosphatase family metal-dependent hydrolase